MGVDARCESCMQIPVDGVCDCSRAVQEALEAEERLRKHLRSLGAVNFSDLVIEIEED